MFILEDRRPDDVQEEARNTTKDLEVISIQRKGITSNCFPHHASFSLYEFQTQETYDSRVFHICFKFVFLLFYFSNL